MSHLLDCVVHVYGEVVVDGLERALNETSSSTRFVAVFGGLNEVVNNRLSALRLRDAARLILVDIAIDLGRGAALRAGFGVATSPYIAILDPAGIRDFGALGQAAERLQRDGAIEAVVANRWKETVRPTLRYVLSSSYSRFVHALFGIRNCDARSPLDVQSPLKVFRRRVIDSTFDEMRLYAVGFDAELLFLLRQRGARFAEAPLSWRSVSAADITPLSVFHTLLALALIKGSHGRVARASFLHWFGRHYIVPVKRSYAILVFAWRDPANPSAGGGEVYLHEQARQWIRDGHSVTWVAQRFRGSAREEQIDGIFIKRVAPFPWVFGAAGFWYVLRSGRSFDFLIDCMNGVPFFTPLFSTKPKFALLYHVHAKHFREELRWPLSAIAVFIETKLVPFLYRSVPFVTISESTKREMEELAMSRFPIALILSGVSENLCPGAKSPHPTILYLGRLRRYKRVRNLIDAFVHVRERFPDAELIIAGTGDDEESLREYVRASGLEGVSFAGRVDEDEKARLMRQAWVFGMPSSLEGWGIVVVEANASGTPAVAYDVGGLRDCIIHEETGLLARSEGEFSAQLIRIIEDSALRTRLGESALAWSKRFSWSATAQSSLEKLRLSQPWRAVFEPEPSGTWRLVRSSLPMRQKRQRATRVS